MHSTSVDHILFVLLECTSPVTEKQRYESAVTHALNLKSVMIVSTNLIKMSVDKSLCFCDQITFMECNIHYSLTNAHVQHILFLNLSHIDAWQGPFGPFSIIFGVKVLHCLK